MSMTVIKDKNGCEFISLELIEEIARRKEEGKVIGVGIYSDEYFLKKIGRNPFRKYEDREKLVRALRNVDFVIKITEEVDNRMITPEEVTLELNLEDCSEKKYRVGYVPGTYDLIHKGHLEHILEARKYCEILVVGVNSDKLVYENKKKTTEYSQEDRMAIVSCFEFVDYVYLVETNSKDDANNWVIENVGYPIDAIFLGSDLKDENLEDAVRLGIDICFTERNLERMKQMSSSYFRELLRNANGS